MVTSQTQVTLPDGEIVELKMSKANPTKKEIKTQVNAQAPKLDVVDESDIKIRRKFTG